MVRQIFQFLSYKEASLKYARTAWDRFLDQVANYYMRRNYADLDWRRKTHVWEIINGWHEQPTLTPELKSELQRIGKWGSAIERAPQQASL